ncbi:MAG: NAD(+) synthase [Pirellulaceae bacterium]|nr:NAD(+) synthase [Planctomycetales bacterium]
MKLIKVAAAVLNQTPLAWDSNRDNIVTAIRQAQEMGVSILCLPELCVTGYGCEDAFHAPYVAEMAADVLTEIVPETEGMIVSVGLPVLQQGGLFNAAGLLVDGALKGLVGKQKLAGDGLHYEPRWFKPWPNDALTSIDIAGTSVPLGDLIFDCGGVRIGFEICEDAWVLDRPGGELAKQGVDVLLNPSASHFAFGKHFIRRRLVVDGSRAFHASYVYANLVGNEAGRAIYDGDAMIASCGQLLVTGSRFSYEPVRLTTATIDVETTRMSRIRSTSFPVDVAIGADRVVRAAFTFPAQVPSVRVASPPSWEDSDSLKEEEFTRAIALGLFDYMRKSRSHGFVVSLSGGADSAAVATLAARMVTFGVQELGRERFCERLSYIPELRTCTTDAAIVERLLTCVYQATRNSSETTRTAARDVALGVGARFLELDVDPMVADYTATIESAIGRQLRWETDDIALQNIQARVRGPSVWYLANLAGALLLATSNRSEAAVGYATMDGDTCGGLSPIAGIDKAFLRQWLRWCEQEGPREVGPFTALHKVNVQAPTAELRPTAASQTDEKDLMPYEVLDWIERAAIRDKQKPADIYQRAVIEFPHYDRQDMATWIRRFFGLWCRNQWKRERYAPSFHVDDENLDPKTWCRFPILSGGYQRELRALPQ